MPPRKKTTKKSTPKKGGGLIGTSANYFDNIMRSQGEPNPFKADIPQVNYTNSSFVGGKKKK